MGLTAHSTGRMALDQGLTITKEAPEDRVIALAGNPNVGKSTIFNALTGLNQHTGNWPGKTVSNAQGNYTFHDKNFILVDIPGTYSLLAHSQEEEVARDFICFGNPDAVVVVCDATCLERNLNLVLQTIEITDKVIVCVNLMDEAEKKHIGIDFQMLAERLGVPIVHTSASRGNGLQELMGKIEEVSQPSFQSKPVQIRYEPEIEAAVSQLLPLVSTKTAGRINSRWTALKLLDPNQSLNAAISQYLGTSLEDDPEIHTILLEIQAHFQEIGMTPEGLQDKIVSRIIQTAERICNGILHYDSQSYNAMDRRLDRILTGKWTGIPVMLALLGIVFWITIVGANYPSQVLSTMLFWGQDRLSELFQYFRAPEWLHGILVLGMYRVLAWVVAVMLPPMAIFFPMFTLLEDLGYLPRVAFNLDQSFKKCRACGKQVLTMCMGFGCNAAGIVGCRIIDSPRERLIAIVTNNFVPCNGRFPPPRLE